MNYCNIKKTDIANGPGVRVSLFVSGCRNHCKGCFQPETWDFNYGTKFEGIKTGNEIIDALAPDYIEGLTILGGDPMEPENIKEVSILCKMIKAIYPKKTIWIYTGYLYEDIANKYPYILDSIDVIVDGPFIQELKDISLKFRGSSNQRVIDVKASKKGFIKEANLW